MKVGAIAKASMALYGGGSGKAREATPAGPATSAEDLPLRPRDLVLVPFGAHGDQIAEVVAREGDAVSVRKWAAASGRFTAPVALPVRRVLGMPAEDDERLPALREALRNERQPRRAPRKRSSKKQ